ncbi:hypothetical protein SCA6_016391 [Theobroma cacao]
MFNGLLTSVSFAMLISLMQAAKITAAIGPATATGKESILELYMHDILGGSSPTPRPVTALLRNQLGFLPPAGGVAIPKANGALPPVNGINGIPLRTGQGGTAFAGKLNNQNVNPHLLGPDGLGLGFGTITVIDDILTSSTELGSQAVGKAQGVYAASSADGTTQMMAFTALIEGGEYGDSLNFYGIYKIGGTMSRLSVTGGTGKFKNVRGLAEVRALIAPGQHVIDGAETLLRTLVHISYRECFRTKELIFFLSTACWHI